MKQLIIFLILLTPLSQVAGQQKKRDKVKSKYQNTEAVNTELPQVYLRGKIRNADDELLIGANIMLSGTSKGVNTNADGEYFFYGLPTGKVTIRASYIGYKTKSVDIYLQTGQNYFNITLDDDRIKIDPIVVTSQKREQQVLDVPAAISVVHADFFDKANLTNLEQISEFVPGMMVNMQSTQRPSFVIRGLTSDEVSPSAQPRVSVFYNNVPVSRANGAAVELFDMEQVEVMKGPQGTLFGKNAQIGAIHFISHKPERDFGGFVATGIGDFKRQEIKGALNIPVIEKKLFTRFSGIFSQNDGYVENTYGENLMGKKTVAGRFSARFLPSYNRKIDLVVNYQKDDAPGVAFMSGKLPNRNGITGPFSYVASLEKGNELSTKKEVLDATLNFRHFYNEHFYFTSISSYRKIDAYERWDGDGTAATALDMSDQGKAWQIFQELRFNYSLNSKLNGASGLSYWREKAEQVYGFYPNEQQFFYLLFNPSGLVGASGQPVPVPALPNLPMLGQLAGMPLPAEHQEETRSWATNQSAEFFTDFTSQFWRKFSITGGARIIYDRFRLAGLSEFSGGSESVLGMLTRNYPNLFFKPYSEKQFRKMALGLTWRGVMKYNLNENANIYIGASRGRRPPVLQFTSTGDKQVIDPEKVMSYDMGFKAAFFRRIWFDLAGFYQKYKDFQASAWLASPATGQFNYLVIDGNNATSYGAETSLKAAVLEGVELFGNFAWIHARFDDADSADVRHQFSGNTFRMTPEYSFTVGLNLKTEVAKGLGFFLMPSYSYKTHFYFEDANTEGIDQDAFGVLNGTAGLELTKIGLSLSAFGSNLLNQRFLISGGNAGSMFGIPTFVPGPPKMLGTRLTWKF